MSLTSRLVFLDADVLAAPVTRTLVLAMGQHPESEYWPVWSPGVEAEADRHVRPGQSLVSVVRQTLELDLLVPDGDVSGEVDTDTKDRHVIGSARSSGVRTLVTRNVHHFGRSDLDRSGISAVHPDVFLAACSSRATYRAALEMMSEARSRPPNTPEAIHAALGREHPRLFASMQEVFPGVEPLPGQDEPPTEQFRGSRCIVCGKLLRDPESLSLGIGPDCRR